MRLFSLMLFVLPAAALANESDQATAIRTLINAQPELRVANIAVSAARGVARLTGEVELPSQKTQAFVDALKVSGIIGVDAYGLLIRPRDREPPVARARDDVEIYNEVVGSIAQDPHVGENRAQVAVRDGVVRLTGTFNNLSARLAAENDAAVVAGVVSVTDGIKVQPSVRFSDDAIRNQIEESMRSDPELSARPIMAQVKDSIVWLHGRVESEGERLLAARDVARVPGVVGLRNGIQVGAPGEGLSDSDIKVAVDIQIDHDPILAPAGGNRIDTVVRNGVVILTGSVVSVTEFTRALLDSFEGGARAVWNQLKLQTGEPPGIAVRYFEVYPGEVYPMGFREPAGTK